MVGDDDQAIYGWRGADVSQILGFPDHQPGCELIRLEQNYRSTGHILRCADAIIRRNEGRLGKTLWSELGDGALVTLRACEDEREEARFVVNEILDALNEDIPPEEIAVFYRTHAQSRVIEQQLTDNGMRYAIFGGLGFFERKEIKDTLAYLRLLQNPNSDLDFTRIVNEPARGIGDTTVGRLTALAANRNVSLLTVARSPEEGRGQRRGDEAPRGLRRHDRRARGPPARRGAARPARRRGARKDRLSRRPGPRGQRGVGGAGREPRRVRRRAHRLRARAPRPDVWPTTSSRSAWSATPTAAATARSGPCG